MSEAEVAEWAAVRDRPLPAHPAASNPESSPVEGVGWLLHATLIQRNEVARDLLDAIADRDDARNGYAQLQQSFDDLWARLNAELAHTAALTAEVERLRGVVEPEAVELIAARRERVLAGLALERSATVLRRNAMHPEHAALMTRFVDAQGAELAANRAFDFAVLTPTTAATEGADAVGQ